ncbi:glycoside hydrolase family 99-like domain-containing protein [Lysobacter sp. HA35]
MTTPPLSRRARSALFKALRAAFRAVPMKESTRDMLRSRFLREFPTVRPLPAQGQVSSTYERRPRVRADERCIGYVEYSEEPLPDPLPATLVAFYLPQFHTIPENDEWWGKGFTEWRNVTRALPQFEGHLQPRLPGDLGFYDLRNPQVMRDQAKLAKTYGLSAFCFYFYWFGGKTLLEEPVRNWLNDKSIDFQYCLCWANENWTRRWDGRDDDLLIAQNHSPEDDIAFIEYVADYLRDPRYLRVDGKPMLLLYRPMLLPDPKATAERWRTWCRQNGVGEIHLAYVQSFERPDPRDIGFDAAVEFPPNMESSCDITSQQALINRQYAGQVLDWRTLSRVPTATDAYPKHPGVNCGWDNEPRRPGTGRTFIRFALAQYQDWVEAAIGRAAHQITFINAWNEWAEGAILEPDLARGHATLAATRSALRKSARLHDFGDSDSRQCVVIHAWYPQELEEIAACLRRCDVPWQVVVTTSPDRADAVRAICEAEFDVFEIAVMENRGRDILPFLRVASTLRSRGYDLVLKLHTKRSPQRADGAEWRRALLRALIPEVGTKHLTTALRDNPSLGIAAPSFAFQPLTDCWGANEQAVRQLGSLLGIDETNLSRGFFIAGSMFWVRMKALDLLLDAPLLTSDFEAESGQLDGTLAHAIERIFAALAQHHELQLGEIHLPGILCNGSYARE